MKNLKTRFYAPLFIFVFALSLCLNAQAQTSQQKAVGDNANGRGVGYQNHKLDSKLMKREMPYRVILPVDYDNSKEKNPIR